MLGVPSKVECPGCKKQIPTWFDDYDIECGNSNPGPGLWTLSLCRQDCGWEGKLNFGIQAKLWEEK
jgi:hypothetical protein